MTIQITDFQPRPLIVIDGNQVTVTITVFSANDLRDCKVHFRNRHTSVAELFDNNQSSDLIQCDDLSIPFGDSSITHRCGFRLQGAAISLGANITLDVWLSNLDDRPLSSVRSIAVAIHAK